MHFNPIDKATGRRNCIVPAKRPTFDPNMKRIGGYNGSVQEHRVLLQQRSPIQITVSPEVARLIEEQIRAGSFASPEEVVEAGVIRLMLDEDELTEEDQAAIRESEEQLTRGEVRDWAEVAPELRRKYLGM